jgi:D-aspartate ligase
MLTHRVIFVIMNFPMTNLPKKLNNRKMTQVPVIVVGGSLNSLGVVRSLSHQNPPLPIIVLETTRACPCAWSRLCRFMLVPTLEGRPLIDALLNLTSQFKERPVLILTDDRAVQTISDFRAEIEPQFRVSLPSSEMVRCLLDKAVFQKFAEDNGLLVPKSTLLEKTSDIRLLESLTMPLVIKPVDKAQSLNGKVARAERADTLDEAKVVSARMMEAAGSVIVQEWIEGPDTNIFFTLFTCDANSNVVASFSGRKIVCNPPRIGNTALCVPAGDASPELEKMTRELIALVKYRGLGSLEFKRDDRSGKYVIVEPTVGRTDWQEEIATLCGVNIPLIAYQTELGLKTAVAQAADPNKMAPFAWRSSRRHKPPKGALADGTKIRGGYFLLKDPAPGVYHYVYELFIERAFSLIGRLAKI